MNHPTLFPEYRTKAKFILLAGVRSVIKTLSQVEKRLEERKQKRLVVTAGIMVILLVIGFNLIHYRSIRKSVLARVNFSVITAGDIALRMQNGPAAYREYARNYPQMVVDDAVNQFLLYRRARWHAWQYRSAIARQMEEYYKELLVKEYVERQIVKKIQISDEEIRSYYNSHLNDFVLSEQVRLSEIVVATREETEDLLNRLILGENFETIALRESISASRDQAGDLGWIDREKLSPEVAEVIAGLKPGQILGKAVKTQVGYHIIKLSGEMPRRVQSLEEASPNIRDLFITMRKRQAVEKYLERIRKQNRIRIYQNNFPSLIEHLP